MTLIKSISGIRGTIGGPVEDTLNPLNIVRFTSAHASLLVQRSNGKSRKIVVGRDARTSGEMINRVVCGTLMGMGLDVVDIGLATTPTTEIAVVMEHAIGGIIITASHNPAKWNALKLLNERGEFLSREEGEEVLHVAESDGVRYAEFDGVGSYRHDGSYAQKHIDLVKGLPTVCVDKIRGAGFRVAIDTVNSVGGIVIPELLKQLGVAEIKGLYTEPTGLFAHNPEPLECNLSEIKSVMRGGLYDVGFVVDPDVDRLAMICEDGSMFGEEYSLVAVADYVLQSSEGKNTVSNLSSTRALRDVTNARGGCYAASAVGEVNVVELMKRTSAVVGGEGNGGIIYPLAHYGRDALVGIALMLSYLAVSGRRMTELRASYPQYVMSKNRIDLEPGTDIDALLERVKERYSGEEINTTDGLKIDFSDGWVHLRRSNTEPIIRVYSEGRTAEEAEGFAREVMDIIGK